MSKLYAVARLLLVVVAIASAFATIPQVAAILIVLGIVTGIGADADYAPRVMLGTLILTGLHATLEAIPAVGMQLSTIFGAIGTAGVGASVAIVTMGLVNRIKGDWV